MSPLLEHATLRQQVIPMSVEMYHALGDMGLIAQNTELLRGCVHAINVTESPRARMAMDPRAVAKLLQDRGIETIVQLTSRDRNRIAIQSDLLGAAALGLRNFVFMGGDSPAGGDHPETKPVFDLTASGLLAAAEALRNGRDYAGNPLSGAPDLFLGATCNPGAERFEAEVENTRRKIDAGARLLQTQAVFHGDSLKRFIDAVKPVYDKYDADLALKSLIDRIQASE